MSKLFIDPDVSCRKFEREITLFRENQLDYHRRGWWLIEANHPTVFVILAAKHMWPHIAMGVTIDFTNYDLLPPSVRLVNPFTREPYLTKQLPTRLPLSKVVIDEHGNPKPNVQNLMQGAEDGIPFLCTPGVLEYHQHSAHADDPWIKHRGSGMGTLYHILNVIHQHGIQNLVIQLRLVNQINLNLNVVNE